MRRVFLCVGKQEELVVCVHHYNEFKKNIFLFLFKEDKEI